MSDTTNPTPYELPSTASYRINQWIEDAISDLQRATDRFVTDAAVDPAWTIAWRAEDLIVKQTLAALATDIRDAVTEGHVDNIPDAFCYGIQIAHRDLARLTSESGNSTSAGHRLADHARATAYAGLFSEMGWHLGIDLLNVLNRAAWLSARSD